jgi:hypothetical protein
MKKALIAAFAALLPAWAAAVHAGVLADLAVVNRATGERIPVHAHRGRLYVAGTPGAKYSILLNNKTAERVLTVVSVDGVNVITGDTAAPAQSGYVLDPWGSVEIEGWRKNMSEVAAFVFTALPESYAARTGRPGNVGVIGVAVFHEYQPPRPPASLHQPELLSGPGARGDEARESARGTSRDSAAKPAAPSTEALMRALPRPEEKLGTGHGEREASAARWTDFRRASSSPTEMISIYYDSRANLMARGIIAPAPRAEPNPFPAFRFTPDPRS